MADETTLGVGIKADVGGQQEVKQFADAVASVSDALRELPAVAKAVARSLESVEKGVTGASNASSGAGRNIRATTEALREQGKVAAATAGTLANAASANARMQATIVTGSYKGSGPTGAAPGNVGIVTGPQREALNAQNAARELAVRLEKQATDELQEQLRLRRELVTAQRNTRLAATAQPQTGIGPGSAAAVAGRFQSSGMFAKEDAAAAAAARKAFDDAKDALGNYNDRLANTRYAMYGLANAVGVAGVAMTAMSFGVLKVAADFELLMANIERTSGLSGTSLDKLNAEFIDLGQTIPTSFADLGNIATLAGQLNVPAERIASFTETIAKFTATTNVSVDSATTAFGRLDTLLPDVQGNYEALGSSILNVGVNSVATEADIISTTTQIAAAGAQAGLTADQVIGLAASFASLGIAPEAARGTTIRVFSEIGTAVNEGGEELKTFAELSGMTAEMFQKAWSQDAGKAFLSVLSGLQKEGGNAETVLRDLGITAVRDINALLRLGQNVEVVAENFGYANAGFEDASQLGASFQKIAETLSAKVQVLANSFQALLGALGSTGLGIIGEFVSGLTDMAKWLTDLAANPFFASVVTAVGGLVALSGILAIAGSGFGHFIAAVLAGRPVMALFSQVTDVAGKRVALLKAEAVAAGGAMTTLGASARVAGAAVKGALVSTGAGAALLLATMAISAAWTEVANNMRSAADVARDRYGDMQGLSTALAADTKAAGSNLDGYIKVSGSIEKSSTATKDWVSTLEAATGTQVALGTATEVNTSQITGQTFAIGKNSEAWLANKVANDEAIQKMFANKAKLEASGLDVTGFATALAKGDTAAATKIYDDFRILTEQRSAEDAVLFAKSDVQATDQMKLALDSVGGALEVAAIQTDVLGTVAAATGQEVNSTTGEIQALGTEAESAAGGVATLADQIANGFAYQNTIAAFASDFYTMAAAIYESGTSFSALDASGQANLSNLQATLASAIAAGQVMGISAAESVGLVFNQLQQSGVDTANLLASLSGMGIAGVSAASVSGYVNGTTQFSAGAQQMNTALSAMAANAKRAAASVGGGSGGVGGAAKKAGGAAKKAAAEIRTLADYASDLGKVFSRSFDLRFSGQNGLDSIATGWREISKATADANKKIEESRVKLQQLTADKDIQNYFLDIATQYGDSLRGNDIAAQIAKINADIAAESQASSDAQSESSKALKGNSEAAIRNRETLQGLVKNYQSYIESLASSGMSQADLVKKTAALKAEFVSQAAAMGFSRAEVNAYAASFNDMSLIIQKVPRNITVNATVNNSPALLALREFEAQAKKTGTTAGSNIANGVRSGVGGLKGLSIPPIKVPPALIPVKYQMPSYAQLMKMQALIRQQTGDPKFRIALGPGGQGGQTFRSGGYTGNFGVNQEAGTVHGQEFVVDAPNTKRLGLPFLNSLNNGAMPTSSAAQASQAARSNATQIVDFSAQAAQILADALNLSVVIPGVAVAKAVSNTNVNGTTRRAS